MPPKKNKESQDDAFWRSAKAVHKRFLASQALRSGKLERLRKENLENGDLPWRIVRYRHVVEPRKIPIPLSVSSYIEPKAFEKQLQYLTKDCQVISLPKLTELLKANEKIPEKTVVVTFDGGHMDSYLYAFPLLLKYQIPATFFLPTAYIGNPTFLYEDRLAMALLFLKKAHLPLPDFSFLTDEVRDRIEDVAPNYQVNDHSMAIFISAMLAASHKERVLALQILGSALSGLFDLPEHEDFMHWDDARNLHEQGMTLGTHGHGYFYASQLSDNAWKEDVQASEEAFAEYELPHEKLFSFPGGELNEDVVGALEQHNYEFAVTIGVNLPPAEQTQTPKILSRVAMAQHNSFCPELFACRLWGIELAGVRY